MKKKISKQIENIAGKLPTIMRQTSERHYVKGIDLINDNRPEVEGKKVNPEDIYVDRYPVQIAINHKRAMKKMFKKYKGEGVQSYINAVKSFQLRQQSQQLNS